MEKQIAVISHLVDGASVRTTERQTEVSRPAVLSLLLKVGNACWPLHDRLMRNLNVSLIQVDEQWSYVGMKQRNAPFGSHELGDQWIFVALDATTKAILAWVVGKRNAANARLFMDDLQSRVVNVPQVTSDGYAPYINAVSLAFGLDVDYAQLVKRYGEEVGQTASVTDRRYSPGKYVGATRKVICGDPIWSEIDTSFVERFNLTSRMRCRRLTRLTNSFSRSLPHHCAAIALSFVHYNLCTVHSKLRVTPAMELGVTKELWSVKRLIREALNPPTTPVAVPPPPGSGPGGSGSGPGSIPPGSLPSWPGFVIVPERGWKRTER